MEPHLTRAMEKAPENSLDPLEETKQFQSRSAQRASVYICYVSADNEAAKRFCLSFENKGTPCWYAARDLTPAMAWPQCIVEAIETSKYFVLLLSEAACASQDILPEVAEAYTSGCQIVVLQSVTEVRNPELEALLTNANVVDVRSELVDEDIESAWVRIVEIEANSTLGGDADATSESISADAIDAIGAESMLVQLECIRGVVKGRTSCQMSPGDRIVFGRGSEADVFVDDDRASRRHAGLLLKKDKKYGLELHLMDLMSRNGTWIRYRREGDADISKFLEHTETRIISGAILRIGSTDIRIKALPIPASIVSV